MAGWTYNSPKPVLADFGDFFACYIHKTGKTLVINAFTAEVLSILMDSSDSLVPKELIARLADTNEIINDDSLSNAVESALNQLSQEEVIYQQ